MVNSRVQKKLNRGRSFHLRYIELCRTKNFAALPEVKAKNNDNTSLDFFGDKLKIDDWLTIIESLSSDQTLRNVAIRLRRNSTTVAHNIDTEKAARLYRHKAAIFTRFIFMRFMETICNLIQFNNYLTMLALEGLPLTEEYMNLIAQAISNPNSVRTLSLCRSPIGDKGCEIICEAVKVSLNVENLYLCNCELNYVGAGFVADMIKFQKIYRYSEGWKNSLRYCEVNADIIPGLRAIFLSQNPKIGDTGAQMIAEILKEDVWMKVIDMEDCGLTNTGAQHILNSLEMNQTLIDFNIQGNPQIGIDLGRAIKLQFGKDSEEEQIAKNINLSKVKIQERMKVLEERLNAAKKQKKHVEILNEQLHEQIMCYDRQLREKQTLQIPEGFVLVKQSTWEELHKERNDLKKALASQRSIKRYPHYKIFRAQKAKSEINYATFHKTHMQKSSYSKSEHGIIDEIKSKPQRQNGILKIHFERNIGDNIHVERKVPIMKPSPKDIGDGNYSKGMDVLKLYLDQASVKSDISTISSSPRGPCVSASSLFRGDF